MSLDRYGRNIHYLRISLTDMCNLRCVYCMPEDMTFRAKEHLLQDDELIRLVSVFSQLGFDKIRLTGGEPTIRENVTELVRAFAQTPGIHEVAMTTNGVVLKHLAKPMVEAGLKRVNVSIDSLDPIKYRKLTRWGNVDDVMAGIHAAADAGLGIKLNAVVVRGQNDGQDVVDLARLTLENNWQVRFIEMMPFGNTAKFQKDCTVSEQELRDKIEADLGPLAIQNNGALEGEARVFKLRNSKGSLGFISSVTKPFCAGCSRSRLTADGKLRLCLLRDKELDLMPFIRDGASDEELKTLIEDAIWLKPWGHGLAENVHPTKRVMSEIGG